MDADQIIELTLFSCPSREDYSAGFIRLAGPAAGDRHTLDLKMGAGFYFSEDQRRDFEGFVKIKDLTTNPRNKLLFGEVFWCHD